VVQNRAYLGWREETETHLCPARLLNISSGGVLIFTEESPEHGQTAWICLENPTVTEWIEVNVVSVVKVPGRLWSRKASCLVRLGFAGPCPYTLFKSATHGHQLDVTRPEPTAPDFDSRTRR
jgi:hypothetical protein